MRRWYSSRRRYQHLHPADVFIFVVCVCVCVCAQSCPALFRPQATLFVARQAPLSMGFPAKNTGAGCRALRQGISPTQGLSPQLLRWQAGSSALSHPGSPRLRRHEVRLNYGSGGSVEQHFAIAVVTGPPRSPACLPETQTQSVGSEPPVFPLPDPGLPLVQ